MKKKIITIMLAAAMLCSMMCSCDPTVNGGAETDNTSSAAEVSSVNETSDEEVSGEAASSDSTSSANTANVDISDDIFSYQVSVDGYVYALPCAFSEFEKNGWELKREEKTLEPNNILMSQELVKGDETITVSLYNDSHDTLNYSDCNVRMIQATPGGGAEVILPGNFVFDINTTADDIIAKYGEPSYKSESELSITLKYEGKEYNQFIRFQIAQPDGELNPKNNTVEIQNMEE